MIEALSIFMEALLIPMVMVVIFFAVIAYLVWRQDHPSR
jgi:preprotein translocase subunit YajC